MFVHPGEKDPSSVTRLQGFFFLPKRVFEDFPDLVQGCKDSVTTMEIVKPLQETMIVIFSSKYI